MNVANQSDKVEAVVGGVPSTAHDPARLAAFVTEWRGRSLSLNWQPVWRDTETDELVDFSAIVEKEALAAASARAERQYLAQIDAARQAFVLAAPEHLQSRRLLEFERALCCQDLYYLGKYVLGYTDAVFHLHYFMARSMQDTADGYRGLRQFSRDTFKTTFMGITFIVQQVLRDPDTRWLYKSNNEGNASNKVREAVNHFIRERKEVRPEQFASLDAFRAAYAKRHPLNAGCLGVKALFPEHVPHTKTAEGSGTEWTTPARRAVYEEATFTAAGVGTSKTSQHYDGILGDDFWDEKSVTSPEVMTKTYKELNSLEYLLATPARGRIVLIGTRFAHDDPTALFLSNPAYHCIIVSGITTGGRSIFPENLALDHMYAQASGQEGSRYVFSCQVMLHPTDECRGFERSWFRYQRWGELRAAEADGRLALRKVILCDAAVDDKNASDFVAIEVVAVDSLSRATVIEYVRAKLTPSAFIDELFRLYDKWQPEFIARQKTALETTIMAFVAKKNAERVEKGLQDVRFYDYSLRKREKKGRITAALQPLLQSGRLWFDPDMANLTELEKELLEHPNSRFDDGADALSMLDDAVISRAPVLAVQHEPLPDTYIPEGVPAPELLFRRQCAKALFGLARDGARRHRRPGVVVR